MLASKSGVSLGSIKRFEQSGEISLQSLTKIAIALDAENELEQLFNEVPLVIQLAESTPRQSTETEAIQGWMMC